MDASKCLCRYCQKMPQREVNASHAPGIMQASNAITTTIRPKSRPKTMRDPVKQKQIYATVQKAPIPVVHRDANVHPKTAMLVERNSDLRAVSSKSTMKLRRWHRTGELLWCALANPIQGPNNSVIDLWPGLVDEVKLKTIPVERVPDQENIDDAVPWSVSQSIEYRMQLLAVNHTYLVSDARVLPYQAHVPSNDLIAALQSFPTDRLNFDRAVMSNFNPCPKDGVATFEDAVAPYAMAVQIGSSLSGFWCLTDEWAFDFYDETQAPTIPRPKSALSLAHAIHAAGQHNEQANTSISCRAPLLSASTSDSQNSHPNTPQPSLNSESLPSTRRIQRQIQFQGLWWGAERVWTDDLVRLKVPRSCLAPNGAEKILPPSGPGKSARAIWQARGKDPNELGAGSRGVLMKLDRLFVVDALQNDQQTIKKECRASGMLYELADDDWEEEPAITALDTNGKDGVAPMSFVLGDSPLNPSVQPSSKVDVPPTATEPPAPASSSSSEQSRPSPYYTMPEAPKGYVFRPILPEGHEAIVSLSFISGRYYTGILNHPLLGKAVEDAVNGTGAHVMENTNLWALEGLSPGSYNSVDPVEHKLTRLKMVQDADAKSVVELEEHKQRSLKEQNGDGIGDELAQFAYPDAMEVDV
ncbi:hypothetical protein H0H92_012775 [Tricholoma furcatifolium]|nr:hypothetical protein H0H92_012775 [Tricholoma furcatifolium]